MLAPVRLAACASLLTCEASFVRVPQGIAFGELALLHNAPRAATVTAEGAVTAWSLDEISFKMILMGKSQTDATDYLGFLEAVPILTSVSEESKKEIASALKETEYKSGSNIICEVRSARLFVPGSDVMG